MATRNFAYRVGVEGESGFVQSYKRMGDAAEQTWDRAQAAAERSAKAAEQAVQRAQQKAAVAASLQPSPVAQRIDQIAGPGQVSGKSARDSAAAFVAALEDEERRATALKAAIDPLWAAEQKLAHETENAGQLLQRGAITAAEHAAAITLAKKAYGEAEEAAKRLNTGLGLNRNQLLELAHVARSAGDSVAAGASIFRVAAVEGGRLTQALGSGEGGLKGGVAAVLKILTSDAVLAGAAIGGFAAITGGAILTADAYATRQENLAQKLRFTAAASGVSAQQFEALTRAQAHASEISAKSAREIGEALLSEGKATATQLPLAIDLTKKLSIALGVDLKAATRDLAEALAKPGEGAEKLNEKLQFLTAAQLQHIRDLELQGEKTKAADLLLKELNSTVGTAQEHLGALAGTFHLLHGAVDGTADGLERFLGYLFRVPSGDAATKVASLAKELDQALAKSGNRETSDVVNARQRLAAAQKDLFADAQRSAQATRSQASTVLKAAFDGLNPTDAQIRTIQDRQTQLRSALADKSGQALADAGVSRSAAEAALVQGDKEIKQLRERAEHRDKHAESLGREADAMEANAAQAVKVAQAYLQDDAAGARAEARRKGITDATRKGIDLAAEERRQLALNIGEQAAQGGKAVADLEARAGAQKSVNDALAAGRITAEQAQQQLQADAALRPFVVAETLAEGKAKAVLAEIIARLRAGYAQLNAETARAQLLGDVEATDKRIAQLRLEAQYAGDLTGKREALLALQKTAQAPAYAGADDRARAAADITALADADQERQTRKAQYLTAQTRQMTDQRELAAAELDLVGQSADQRALILSHLQREQAAKAEGLGLSQEELAALLAQGDAVDLLNLKIRIANDNFEEFRSTGERIVDDVLNPQTFKSWGDAGRAVINDLIAEFVKLALANPLKNLLFGENLPTGSGIGGFLGKLFSAGVGAVSGAPHFASGTTSAPGGWAVVGEQGEELVRMPRGSQVFNAADTRRMLGGSGSAANAANDLHVHVHLEGAVMGEEVKSWVAQGVVQAVKEANGNVLPIIQSASSRRQI
jgi:uncharacterized protein YjiS (DUF1127 family)